MKKLIWLPLAGALLIGGAAATSAAQNVVQEVTANVASMPGRAGNLLAEVLADLVEQSVITQDQSDAITDELDARIEAKRLEFEAEREEMQAVAEQIRTFLEDDVITADEVAQLPDSELKTALEGLLADGDITVDRLRELRLFFFGGRGGHGPGHHFRGGPGMWAPPGDIEQAPDANEEVSEDAQDS